VIIGTVVINNHTEVAWTVTSSKMIDPWTCGVVVQRYNLDAILVEKIITLPSVHWRYDSVPGDPMNFDITYTDQYVPRYQLANLYQQILILENCFLVTEVG